ncbi:uncharacterized protein LOC134176373 [Corticium candelabrum]|uniref:uncharacterized protein LOC134176373 n=1 Tax=Corticium candelabrum TaxID=121492 RepID=UPI002E267CD9|nr:uncharacterized protein LOC134176373 [Corticium candelabrum]
MKTVFLFLILTISGLLALVFFKNTKAETYNEACLINTLFRMVSELQATLKEMKTDVTDLKTEVTDLKTEVNYLKTEVIELKSELESEKEERLKLEMSHLELRNITVDLQTKDISYNQSSLNLQQELEIVKQQLQKHLELSNHLANDSLELNENVAQLQRDNSLHDETLKVHRRLQLCDEKKGKLNQILDADVNSSLVIDRPTLGFGNACNHEPEWGADKVLRRA